ncbi:FAD-dependent monooxygenase [Glaciibacter superstes]|uniref:FAD-dependent monooxygenase n=1 Tax=Glaciibacter superstes TaxID=501023 RepID=UPI0009FC9472|nr:FAD-dependent monooxygenase [Glaciibacter superstes]
MLTLRWRAQTIANSRQAARYSVGRAFLAGDAAHIFSAGGAALNTGMLDALDLADRLIAMIRKSAATSVLDGYETTRHPAGHRALIQTSAQAALNAISPEGAALREVFAEFLTSRNPRRYLSELLSGD